MTERMQCMLSSRIYCFFVFLAFGTIADCFAQEDGGPVVARVQMQFVVKDEVIDVIGKGDVLTIQRSRDDAYLVLTPSGKRGWVPKVNALALAESVEIYDDLIKASPEEGSLHTMRAAARWARGEQKKALADCDRAIELGYKEPDAYTSRGLFRAALEQYDGALEDYGEAIKLEPKNASAYLNRAAVYMTTEKYELAVRDYDEAVRLDGKNPNHYQQRAIAWKAQNRTDRAIEDFAKAIGLDAEHVPALMGRGFTWFEIGDSEKAIADFSRVIEIDPLAAAAFNNRGYNYQLLEQHDKALADYDKAIELAPKYSLAFQNKAWLLALVDDDKLRNGKRAIAAAEKACELNDYKFVGDLRALAAALAEDGQFEKAIGWQEKVLAMVKDNKEAAEFEQRIMKRYQDKQPYPVEELSEEESPEDEASAS